MTIRPFMIAGEWTQGRGEPFVSINPADGSEAARIAGASPQDVDDAVKAARAALSDPAWANLKQHQRARLLTRMAELCDANIDVLARAQMLDNGKAWSECRAQASEAGNIFRYYAAVCETIEADLTPQRGPSVTMTVYEPVGVVVAITPWNSPVTIEPQKIAPILAAGNTMILKPSEVTPQVSLEYARLSIEAGFPKGVFNVVTGAGDVGKALTEHPGVDMLSFTGGPGGGRAVAEAAAKRFRPVILELGGKSPNIVFADADFEKAAKGVAGGIFSGSGQSCIAGSRVFVERSIHDRFLEALAKAAQIYNPAHPEADKAAVGSLSSFQHRKLVASMVDDARAEGGRVVTGGEIPTGGVFDKGAYYPPTIIADVTNRSGIAQKEVFGPVAAVIPFDDEADLLAQANDTDYGLASGIWTSDFAKAWRVARALRAGTVWINTYKEGTISAPFGGFKQSGLGREKGILGMRAYMEPKSIYWRVE